MGFIKLKHDRMCVAEERRKPRVFLESGTYEIARELKELGSLIITGGSKNKPVYSIVRSEHGTRE